MDEFFNVKGLNGYYFFVTFLKENDFLSFAVQKLLFRVSKS
jgi:hypothetical protein